MLAKNGGQSVNRKIVDITGKKMNVRDVLALLSEGEEAILVEGEKPLARVILAPPSAHVPSTDPEKDEEMVPDEYWLGL